MDHTPKTIDCACVIHGDAYSWQYVDRLYNMLQRNLTATVRLHVYTEASRSVPAPMIKHELTDWGISGPKRSWWYKIQLFNSALYAGPLLYMDLDVVIVDNIDWICDLSLNYFWALQDFKHLWRPSHLGMNSSVMWWDTRKYNQIFQQFRPQNLQQIIKNHAGDQDYLTREISEKTLRFINPERIRSWRWECLDGGYNFKKRCYYLPNSGTLIPKNTSILVFHGQPKPDKIKDGVIDTHWQ